MSLIVRFRNEVKYLDAVLRAIRAQRCECSVEIVAVDNASGDASREIARCHADILLDIADYRPGVALNKSIQASSGDWIVVLSAHALPASERWLEDLTSHLHNPHVLGIYGAQTYPVTSKFLDKRDLDIFSDIHPRTELRDSDFWNANSAFGRVAWEKQPFDETVVELEDHLWTKQQLPAADRWVRFEPAASVYHYGHDLRNDRSFVPPGGLTDTECLDRALDDLADDDVPWPTAMTAGLTLGSMTPTARLRQAVPVLGRHLLRHPDFDVRWRMAAALGRLPFAESVPFLIQGLNDPSFYPRDECAWSLARLGELAVPGLLATLDTLAERVRPFAALALGKAGSTAGRESALDLLTAGVRCDEESTVRDSLYFLGEIASVGDRHGLLNCVSEQLAAADYRTARAAIWCWGALAGAGQPPPGLPVVVELARSHPLDVLRAEAVAALGRVAEAAPASRTMVEVARSLSRDGAGCVRYAAMQTLRLSAGRGSDLAAEAAASHTADRDFGVMFERSLALAHAERL